LPHGAHQNTFAERQHHRQDAPYLPVIPIAAMPCESGASSKQSQIIEYRIARFCGRSRYGCVKSKRGIYALTRVRLARRKRASHLPAAACERH
jgi:hypothetical protein